MPETPEELHRRAAGALRVPPVHEWDSWPFEGELRVRELRPPDAREIWEDNLARVVRALHQGR